jgi:thioredoxin-related protein
MISRRSFLEGAAALGAAGMTALPAGAGPLLTEDGLYTQPWFLESFLILPEDLEGATAKGKRFALLWELKGCPYCRKMHLVNFADPTVEAFIRARFEILQLNIVGAKEVTDFDGEKLSEKRLAEKYGVRGTPTLQFFPEQASGLAARKPQDREVFRVQGYVEPEDFRRRFAFVAEKAYERGSFADYLKAQG